MFVSTRHGCQSLPAPVAPPKQAVHAIGGLPLKSRDHVLVAAKDAGVGVPHYLDRDRVRDSRSEQERRSAVAEPVERHVTKPVPRGESRPALREARRTPWCPVAAIPRLPTPLRRSDAACLGRFGDAGAHLAEYRRTRAADKSAEAFFDQLEDRLRAANLGEARPYLLPEGARGKDVGPMS
jgi:hypothetical protein